ncbi:MAG: ATP-binding protein, partial [Candidatus Saliniplasma sp.]
EEVEHLIQVSYNVDDKITKKREVNGLIKGSDALRCDDLTVLTWDHGETIEKEGKKIIFKPVWRWLIELDNI